jgi:ABC-type Fe3+-siderophore transport system permease subunit
MKSRWAWVILFSSAILLAAPLLGSSLEGPRGDFLLWQLRVPRVLMGALVGGTLSLAGAVFQLVLENPLATPDTVGTTAGATLGALAALVIGGFTPLSGFPLVAPAAFAGALGVSLLVGAVASSGRARVNDVLLAGVAAALGASALATGLEYLAGMNAIFAASRWSLGHLPQVGYRGVVLVAPAAVGSWVGLLASWRALRALTLGQELAHSQGVDVPRLRTWLLGTASLAVAACVAWCGPIAFVGLVVPHLVRLVLGRTVRVLLSGSLVLGAAFLVACDTLARLALPGRELPVGVLTAALGAPTLLWLVLTQRRG